MDVSSPLPAQNVFKNPHLWNQDFTDGPRCIFRAPSGDEPWFSPMRGLGLSTTGLAHSSEESRSPSEALLSLIIKCYRCGRESSAMFLGSKYLFQSNSTTRLLSLAQRSRTGKSISAKPSVTYCNLTTVPKHR